jgi:hypothetical protein
MPSATPSNSDVGRRCRAESATVAPLFQTLASTLRTPVSRSRSCAPRCDCETRRVIAQPHARARRHAARARVLVEPSCWGRMGGSSPKLATTTWRTRGRWVLVQGAPTAPLILRPSYFPVNRNHHICSIFLCRIADLQRHFRCHESGSFLPARRSVCYDVLAVLALRSSRFHRSH